LIERFSFGYVVDYIFIFTGVLNIADLYILTGVLLAVLQVRKKS
jgi:lipoprotein signal peptidase